MICHDEPSFLGHKTMAVVTHCSLMGQTGGINRSPCRVFDIIFSFYSPTQCLKYVFPCYSGTRLTLAQNRQVLKRQICDITSELMPITNEKPEKRHETTSGATRLETIHRPDTFKHLIGAFLGSRGSKISATGSSVLLAKLVRRNGIPKISDSQFKRTTRGITTSTNPSLWVKPPFTHP